MQISVCTIFEKQRKGTDSEGVRAEQSDEKYILLKTTPSFVRNTLHSNKMIATGVKDNHKTAKRVISTAQYIFADSQFVGKTCLQTGSAILKSW